MRVVFTVEHPDALDPVKKVRIHNERVQVSVKEEFVKKFPEVTSKTFKQLVTGYPFYEALDNDAGAAVKSLSTDVIRWYFVDGRMLSLESEEYKRLVHKETFNEGIESILKG